MHTLPDWARVLIAEKTPFLASDPEFQVTESRWSDEWLSFKARGFHYTAIRALNYIR